jgi:hypothetical protein
MPSMPDLSITFHVEPADRSVGIMSEGFSAWLTHGAVWCNLEDVAKPGAFQWYANDTGDPCDPPRESIYVERALLAFAQAWYDAHAG